MKRRNPYPIDLELAADVFKLRAHYGWTGRVWTLSLPGHRSILYVREHPPRHGNQPT